MFFFNKYGILFFWLCVFTEAVEEAENATLKDATKKFYLSLDKANYFEAFVHCKQGGMQLASIETEEESNALDNFLDPYKIDGTVNGFWLSGTHLVDTSSFQYYWLSTGARAIFTNWFPDQPDNSGGQEHCLQWVYHNASSKPTGWNDWICNNSLRYVCEHISN